MPAFALIAGKDLRLLIRDRPALFWVVGFPIAFAAFFGSVLKAGVEEKTAPLNVVLIDEGETRATQRVLTALKAADVHVRTLSSEAARTAVRRGTDVAFLRVLADGRVPRVELGIDPSRKSETALLRSVIAGAVQPLPANVKPARIDVLEVARESAGPSNGFQIVFPAMVLWGLLGCAATFAVAMVAERTNGTMLRLRAAPIARASVLGGKAAACVAACIADCALLTAIGIVVLGVHIADPLKYAAAVVATVSCFAGLTMALSLFGRTEQSVAGAGWATLILMAMLGGAMVPLSLMPSWLLTLSDLSPVKWGITALEGATWRGFGWHELGLSLLRLVGFGVAAFLGAAAILGASADA